MAGTVSIVVQGGTDKGYQKRNPREEAALRVRMLNGRHVLDIARRAKDELGDRGHQLGPIDMSRNPLRAYVNRVCRAYYTPPLVNDLPEGLARMIGDQSATTTIARYAKAGGRPMPTRMAAVSAEALRYRSAANWAGTCIGFSQRSARPFLEVITPDDLDVEYLSDDPLAPTRIIHRRRRMVKREAKAVEEVYDLTDLDEPSYRVFHNDRDITGDVFGMEFVGGDYWWRYGGPDGRPFHRIIVSGDPREPYRGVELVEGSLTSPVLWTHWKAGVRDAGHPQRNSVGLVPYGHGSDASGAPGEQGVSAGPEDVVRWTHEDPERPGSLHQFGPGFDPEVVGRAVRQYDMGLHSVLGVEVDFERTGGEPTETERRAMEELITSTFAACRGHDSLVLRRTAAVCNRATAMLVADGRKDVEATTFPEAALPVLYRQEVTEALAAVEASETPEENTDG